MSSIGAIGTLGPSTFCFLLCRRTSMSPELQAAQCGASSKTRRTLPDDYSLRRTCHRLEGEIAEPLGLARVDQGHHRGESGILVCPEDDGSGQAVYRIYLLAGRLEVELDQVGQVLDGLEGFVQWLHLAADQQVSFAVDVQDDAVFGDGLGVLDRPSRASDWKTTSSKGVRLGSARTSPVTDPAIDRYSPGGRSLKPTWTSWPPRPAS